MPNTVLQVELPDDLIQQATAYVANGWAANLDELLAEALDRYLRSHPESLAETFARADIAWGLYGKD